MSDLLPFLITGMASGAIFGLAGVGLVLTYKTSGIFNFAHGAIATASAYLFYWLHVEHEVAWWLAFLVSVLVAGPLMGIGMERLAARLSVQGTASKIVGTVGLVLVVQAAVALKFGPNPILLPQYLPSGRKTVTLGGVNIAYDVIAVTVISVVVVLALAALFRWSRRGVAMRAVVDDPELLAIQGTNPVAVRRTAWVLGSTLAALSGVLIAPFIGLEAIALTFLVVQAFGAAAIGSFSSIGLTFLGGIAIGMVADGSKKYVFDYTWLTGLPSALPFVVLFVVLLLLPRQRLVPISTVELTPSTRWRAPARVRAVTGVIVLVPLVFVPSLVGTHLPYFTTSLAYAVMLLSLGLLVRMSGHVSLAHAAFAAIGAVSFSQFRIELGLPWAVALVLGCLLAVPVGAIVAIPAIRLSGLFLALATFGFGIMIERLLYTQPWMFTTLGTGRRVDRPPFAESDRAYYYVVLAGLVLTALLVAAIGASRLGRLLRGLADSPRGISTMGLDTNVTKVVVFCVSAFLAALAGILYSGQINYALGQDRFFSSFNSLVLLAMLAVAPFAEPWYALVAASMVVPGYFDDGRVAFWLNAVFGVFAVVVAVRRRPPAVPAPLRAWAERWGPAGRRPIDDRPARPPIRRAETPAAAGDGLEVRDLRVRFGGLVAVDGVSFQAGQGRITGLIGPNGAGKTTTFDACSGLNLRIQGQVLLHGRDLAGEDPASRARRGLGRTFQRVELCDTMTTFENVLLGYEAGLAGRRVLSQLHAPRSQWAASVERATEALALCGIAGIAEQQAGMLSTGQRRLVELARCLAGRFDFLLLDEPSSGLDSTETRAFAEILLHVVEARGVGILLVEHDMEFVMRICDAIHVLDFGQLIYSGSPQEVAASDVVRAAYLGSTEIQMAETGAPAAVSPA